MSSPLRLSGSWIALTATLALAAGRMWFTVFYVRGGSYDAGFRLIEPLNLIALFALALGLPVWLIWTCSLLLRRVFRGDPSPKA